MQQSIPIPIARVQDIGLAAPDFVRTIGTARLRRLRLALPLAAAGLVVGCAGIPNIGTDVSMTGMPNTEVALRESMRLVDTEIGKLGRMAPPVPPLPPAPHITVSPPIAPAPPPLRAVAYPVVPGELQKVIVFTWTGTLEAGVRQLADDIGYVTTIALPGPGQASLPVSITTGPVPVIQALQALGDAAGTHATVRVDPVRRQVDVLYHA